MEKKKSSLSLNWSIPIQKGKAYNWLQSIGGHPVSLCQVVVMEKKGLIYCDKYGKSAQKMTKSRRVHRSPGRRHACRWGRGTVASAPRGAHLRILPVTCLQVSLDHRAVMRMSCPYGNQEINHNKTVCVGSMWTKEGIHADESSKTLKSQINSKSSLLGGVSSRKKLIRSMELA